CRRVSGVHHRGNGESGGLPSGGEAGRRHRSRHPGACRKAEEQGITKTECINEKRKNAYEIIKSENDASQQVPYRIGGHDAAILRRGRQPPQYVVRELGERGGKARRAYLQGGRSLQGDGVPP